VLFGLRGCRASPPGEVTEELERLEALVEESSRRLRRLLQDLRPSTLEDVGLAASLRGLADRVGEDGLDVELRADLDEPPVDVRIAIFRIVQEALLNVMKHSDSAQALVEIVHDDSAVLVSVADRGAGFPGQEGQGLGLWLMRERAEAVGGTLSVDSGSAGTRVVARIPLRAGR